MLRRSLVLSLVCIFVLGLSGCATGRKQKDLEAQGLRNQVSASEGQLQVKDEEVSSLKESLVKTPEQGISEVSTVPTSHTVKKQVIAEVKSLPNTKQIQVALQNAGYNPGSIDGKMGRQTREAIKEFQRANNLAEDGKVGKKTWGLLKEYLYKKLK